MAMPGLLPLYVQLTPPPHPPLFFQCPPRFRCLDLLASIRSLPLPCSPPTSLFTVRRDFIPHEAELSLFANPGDFLFPHFAPPIPTSLPFAPLPSASLPSVSLPPARPFAAQPTGFSTVFHSAPVPSFAPPVPVRVTAMALDTESESDSESDVSADSLRSTDTDPDDEHRAAHWMAWMAHTPSPGKPPLVPATPQADACSLDDTLAPLLHSSHLKRVNARVVYQQKGEERTKSPVVTAPAPQSPVVLPATPVALPATAAQRALPAATPAVAAQVLGMRAGQGARAVAVGVQGQSLRASQPIASITIASAGARRGATPVVAQMAHRAQPVRSASVVAIPAVSPVVGALPAITRG